ncbi:MAG TPA: response regulator [Malonomonas sp.]
MARKRMGEILLETGIISQDTLDKALSKQKGSGKRLGQILEEMDVVLEEDIAKALGKQFNFPYVKGLARYRFPPEVLALVDAETALTNFIFPLKLEGRTLHLAMSNPLDMALQNDLSFKIGLRIAPCVTTPEEIKAAVQKYYIKEIEATEEERAWNILIVDDQDIVLSAAEAALKKEGYTVYKASNGAEGLKMAIQVRPHLIITDVIMPRMDGIEMFRALKGNRGVADIPVIALSAKASAEEEYRLLEMGFYDFVPKPINPIRLTARVRRAMKRNHGAHQE